MNDESFGQFHFEALEELEGHPGKNITKRWITLVHNLMSVTGLCLSCVHAYNYVYVNTMCMYAWHTLFVCRNCCSRVATGKELERSSSSWSRLWGETRGLLKHLSGSEGGHESTVTVFTAKRNGVSWGPTFWESTHGSFLFPGTQGVSRSAWANSKWCSLAEAQNQRTFNRFCTDFTASSNFLSPASATRMTCC